MPNIVSHYLLSKRLESYLDTEYPSYEYSKNALLWGAQGPDFLWSANCLKPNLKSTFELASEIHKGDPDKTLLFMSAFCEGADNPTERGYLMGFYSHYALDSLAHPFVNFGSEQAAESGEAVSEAAAHAEIEINLDTILLRYECGSLPNELRLKKCLPMDEMVISHISLIYSLLAKQIFEQDIDILNITAAAKKFCKYVKHCYDPLGIKRDFHIKAEKLAHKDPFKSLSFRPITEDDSHDYANILHNEWTNGGTVCTKSFFDLYEDAFNLLKAMADAYINKGSLPSLTMGRKFV